MLLHCIPLICKFCSSYILHLTKFLTKSSQRKSSGFLASTICMIISLLSITLHSCLQNSRFLSNGVITKCSFPWSLKLQIMSVYVQFLSSNRKVVESHKAVFSYRIQQCFHCDLKPVSHSLWKHDEKHSLSHKKKPAVQDSTLSLLSHKSIMARYCKIIVVNLSVVVLTLSHNFLIVSPFKLHPALKLNVMPLCILHAYQSGLRCYAET